MPYILQATENWLPQSILPASKCPVTHISPALPSIPPQTPSFERLRPIMARLPTQDGSNDEELDFAKAYYRAGPGFSCPGTLDYDNEQNNVSYTRARLPAIDAASKDLWVALHSLLPVTTSYAAEFPSRVRLHKKTNSESEPLHSGCPMSKSGSCPSALELVRKVFNWHELRLSESTEASFYGVVFQSKRAKHSGAWTQPLMEADKLSHEEAVNAGGLLMYWYGVPDPATGLNLATCIWSSREEARAASDLPLHRLAVRHATRAYEDFRLSRYKVVKLAGETGIRIEEWDL